MIEALVVGVGVELNGRALQHLTDICPVLEIRSKNRIVNINKAMNIALEKAWDETSERGLPVACKP